jgi:hypothetical protein
MKEGVYKGHSFFYAEGKKGPIFFTNKSGKNILSESELKKAGVDVNELFLILEKNQENPIEKVNIFAERFAFLSPLGLDPYLLEGVKKLITKDKLLLRAPMLRLHIFILLEKQYLVSKKRTFEIETNIENKRWPFKLVFGSYKHKFIANIPELLMINFALSIKKKFPNQIFEFKKI